MCIRDSPQAALATPTAGTHWAPQALPAKAGYRCRPRRPRAGPPSPLRGQLRQRALQTPREALGGASISSLSRLRREDIHGNHI
eukprot:8815158-Pyramimonas_sp.AAC.1